RDWSSDVCSSDLLLLMVSPSISTTSRCGFSSVKCSAFSSLSISRVTRVYSSAGQVRTARIVLAIASRGTTGSTSKVAAVVRIRRRVSPWAEIPGGGVPVKSAMFVLCCYRRPSGPFDRRLHRPALFPGLVRARGSPLAPAIRSTQPLVFAGDLGILRRSTPLGQQIYKNQDDRSIS